VTTDSNHKFNIAPNLLNRNFVADRPNQKWLLGDASIACQLTGCRHQLYLDPRGLAISGRGFGPVFAESIGWAVSNRMKRDLAIRALDMAVALRKPPKGCIHHSDRGSQYCSHDYQKRLRQHGFKASMSGKGNCYDNAVVEAFFKTITYDDCYAFIYRAVQSRADLAASVAHAQSRRTGDI
jgi:putative transposase